MVLPARLGGVLLGDVESPVGNHGQSIDGNPPVMMLFPNNDR